MSLPNPIVSPEFGIVANALRDPLFRKGSLCWLVGGWTGGCYERVKMSGLSKGGRRIEKWSALKHFENFRVKWIPDHVRARYPHMPAGTRREMERSFWND